MAKSEEQIKREESLSVILALALEKKEELDSCIESEDLAAWHENTLPAAEKERLASHLSRCNSCYELWMEMADPIEELMAESEAPPVIEKKQTSISQLVEWLGSLFRNPWAYGTGFGGALAAIMVVFIMLPGLRMDRLDSSISDGFQSLPPGLYISLLPVPKPDSSRFITKDLFAQPVAQWSPASPFEEAFAHGVRQGLLSAGELGDEDKALFEQLPTQLPPAAQTTSEKDWNRYTQALAASGKWTVLIRMACTTDRNVPAEFWKEQVTTLDTLQEIFSSTDKSDDFKAAIGSWQSKGMAKDLCPSAERLLEKVFVAN